MSDGKKQSSADVYLLALLEAAGDPTQGRAVVFEDCMEGLVVSRFPERVQTLSTSATSFQPALRLIMGGRTHSLGSVR